MKVDGRCHCGFITIEAEVDPAKVTTVTAPIASQAPARRRISVPTLGSAFKMTGQPTLYGKIAESGNRRAQAFCPNCGSPIYSTTPGDGPKD